MHDRPRFSPVLRSFLTLLLLFAIGCGGGGGDSSVPGWVLLSRLYQTSVSSKTFQENPPGDPSGNYTDTYAALPSPCSPLGSVNLVSTHILDSVFVSGRHERLYLHIQPNVMVTIKGAWLSPGGGNGDFLVFDPPISFPDMMFLNTPVQRSGQVMKRTGVPFATDECDDFSGDPDAGAYDFVYTYTGVAPVTVPAGSWPGAYQLLRNEIVPGQTRTRTSHLGGGLGEVYWEETGKSGALQSTS